MEGHGFTRAVNGTAIPGFSRWGTVLLSAESSYALIKRCPQGLFGTCHGTSRAKCEPAANSKHFTDATTVEIGLSLSSEKAVKKQIWCATAAYTLIAINKIYTCLQIPSVSVLKYRFHEPCSKLSQTPPALPR